MVGGAGAARPLRAGSLVSRPTERDRLAAQFGGRRGLARGIPPARSAKLPARHPWRDTAEPNRPRRADALKGRTVGSQRRLSGCHCPGSNPVISCVVAFWAKAWLTVR